MKKVCVLKVIVDYPIEEREVSDLQEKLVLFSVYE